MRRREADVRSGINDLNEAQVTALRVAVSHFLSELAEPAHMRALGAVGPLYQVRLREIEALLVEGAPCEHSAQSWSKDTKTGEIYCNECEAVVTQRRP